MGTLTRGGVYLFEGFRLDRNTGAFYRQHEDGSLLPIAIGSRALDVLGVLVEQAGDVVTRTS
jgi:DNA-binding winged helix-turn-helix (wHTH) protein